MRKLLQEVQEIDRYLMQEMPDDEKPVFEARLIISSALAEKVSNQQKTHQFIRWFARNEQRRKLQSVYNRLMQDSTFNEKITAIFK